MANTKQAAKRAELSEKRRQWNASRRSQMRTLIKKVRQAVEQANLSGAEVAFAAAQSIVDRFAQKGLIHRNAAARYKSRLARKIKALAA